MESLCESYPVSDSDEAEDLPTSVLPRFYRLNSSSESDKTGDSELETDVAAHDETGTDVTAHDETGTDVTAHDEAGTDATAHDETGTDVTAHDETATDVTAHDETGTDVTARDETETYVTAHDETETHVAATATAPLLASPHRTPGGETAKEPLAVPRAESSSEPPEAEGADYESDEVAASTRFTTYAIPAKDLPEELKVFVKRLRNYWTKTHNLERRGPSVNDTTFKKTRERLLCYLGYLRKERRSVTLAPVVFEDTHLIEQYLDYLKVERALRASTLSNHVSSIIYAVKYIHRDSCPAYEGVQVLAQLRTMATQLQRQGDRERPQTKEDLERLGKWMDWPDILKALRLQNDKFQLARGTSVAKESMDLILLALYTTMPPSRALEIRTLKVFAETRERPFVKTEHEGENLMIRRLDRSYLLFFQSFKTKSSRPADEVEIKRDGAIDLPRLITDYLTKYREQLLRGQEDTGAYVFLNHNGQAFRGGAFTSHIQGVFQKLVGVRISVNCLRASFITWAYEQKDCTDALKDSIASALRHSRKESEKTYDKRTSLTRKRKAIDLARTSAEQALHEEQEDEEQEEEEADGPPAQRPAIGSFVALVEERSTLSRPAILLGRVQGFPSANEASLLWYEKQHKNVYVLRLNGEQWVEPLKALVPVQTSLHKHSGGFILINTIRSIHKSKAT